MRSLRLLAATAALAAALTTCGRGASGDAMRVGVLYPLTGSQGVQGTEEARGVELAAEWANEHGGINGQRLELARVDAPRAEAVPAAMAKLAGEGVRVVVGSHGSAVSAAAGEAATKHDLVFWETGAVGQLGPDVAGGEHFFRMAPMGANLGAAAIDFLTHTLQPKLGLARPLRIAVANVDDVYGGAVADGAAAQVAQNGAELAGRVTYPLSGGDYDALATEIDRMRPDALFVAAYLDDGVALRQATVRHHIHLAASIGTSSSYCHPAFGDRLGADAVGLFASDKPDAADVRADALSAEGRRSLEWARTTYRQRFGADMGAPALSGFSNAYALFVHVLPRARAQRTDDVASAALATKLPEGTLANGGGVDFAPPGQPDAGANRASAGVIWEWVAPRTRAVVWPPAFATHPVEVIPLEQ